MATPSQTLTVEVIEDIERLIAIELVWDELYARDPHAHVFLSTRYLSAIATRVSGNFRILAAWSEDGRCVGLLPLLVTVRWNKSVGALQNVYEMLGHVFDADYAGMLCEPGKEDAVCSAFSSALSSMPVGRFVFSFFAGPAQRFERLLLGFDEGVFEVEHVNHKINDGETDNLVCPYLDLPGSFESYLQSLSANTRQKFRRMLREFDRDPDLKITRSRPETYEKDAALISELWFLQYAERKGGRRAQGLIKQLRETTLIGLANGQIHLPVLWRGGEPVAAQACYIDPVHRQALFHVGARNLTLTDMAVGTLLHLHAIRWAIANGLHRYDFTIGDEPYKFGFGAHRNVIGSAIVQTRTGLNIGEDLDPASGREMQTLAERYFARGRLDDARTVAKQADRVRSDLRLPERVEALIKARPAGSDMPSKR